MARYDMPERDTAIGTRWSGVTRMTGLKPEGTESPLVCLFREAKTFLSPPTHLEIKVTIGHRQLSKRVARRELIAGACKAEEPMMMRERRIVRIRYQ